MEVKAEEVFLTRKSEGSGITEGGNIQGCSRVNLFKEIQKCVFSTLADSRATDGVYQGVVFTLTAQIYH